MGSKLIVVSGLTASGKSAIVDSYMGIVPHAHHITSVTTSPERARHTPGEYEYVSNEEFDRLLHARSFLWDISHKGYRYGTTREAILKVIELENHIGVMTLTPDKAVELYNFLDWDGRNMRRFLIPFWISPPPEKVLRERMTERGESPQEIAQHLKEEAEWPIIAAAHHELFIPIDNSGTVRETALRMRDLIQERDIT